MRKTTNLTVIFGIILPVLWLALEGCTVNKEMDKTGELESVEVREYQGEGNCKI